MIGVSWRHGRTESLAEFTLDAEAAGPALKQFAAEQGLGELAYLATCNRVELIFRSLPGTRPRDIRSAAFELLTGRPGDAGEAERRLRAWQGEGAAEHLFVVAAGLDSAAVGEAEIVGQVRNSQALADSLGLLGPTLRLIFEEAQKIAARVRGETALGHGRVSLAEIAVDEIRARIARTPGTVALIGVSPMTERAAKSLAASAIPFIVVNRSLDRAASLADRFGAGRVSLDDFRSDPPAIEALLSATGASEAILGNAALERLAARTHSGEPPLIVDMAVPADISISSCEKLGIRRIGMDAIVEHADNNRSFRISEAAQAREQVDQALDELQSKIAERYYGPLLGALQFRYRQTAEEGLRRLLKKDLAGLGEAEKDAIETWTRVLARRFAHIPCLGLRGLINTGPDGSIEAFLNGLEPEFADDLRAALATADDSGNRAPANNQRKQQA